jgi:hypothetical protein
VRRKERLYPIHPVAQLLAEWGKPAHCLPDHLEREFFRAKHEGGVTESMADAFATELGRHPSELWPNWGRDELLREVS